MIQNSFYHNILLFISKTFPSGLIYMLKRAPIPTKVQNAPVHDFAIIFHE
jgi:hypothetical protein